MQRRRSSTRRLRGRAAGQAHRTAQASCAWTWLSVLQTHQPPKCTCHPIPLQAAPSAAGRSPIHACWSPNQVPLTEDTAARQASTDVASGEGPGHLQTLGSRRPGQPSWQPQEPVPRSPPPPKDYSVSGPTPAGSPVTSSFCSEGEDEALGLQHQPAGSEVTPR